MISIRFIEGRVEALENSVNLCESCKEEYAECGSTVHDIIFGDGEGDDNICYCSHYKPLKVHDWAKRRHE